MGKRFADGTMALVDATFSIHPGEFVAIVGPSGCGKSTLLRIAAGLTTPTEGAVELGSRNLGYVFQDATLLPWRTVEQNVGLLAELEKLPKNARAARVSEAIAVTGLRGFEHHHPHTLSGGMRMRASLARALTMKPTVFLFDEPFGALDELNRERLNDELQRLFTTERFAGLFVTHSISEAVYLSSRVLVMSDRPGRILSAHAVPFPYPRTPDTRFDPEFARLSREVSLSLRMSNE